MKNVKILRKLSQLRPFWVAGGSHRKKIFFYYYLTGQYVSFLWQNFCCKAYQWPKKALILENSSKIGRKSPKYPPRALFGGPTKIFFYKMLHHIIMNVFYDKSFALKSKIKNFKIFRMLLALKIKKLAKSGTMDRMILGEFAIFHSQGPPGQENHGGTRSMGGVQYPPMYLPHYKSKICFQEKTSTKRKKISFQKQED